jgi:carbamoyltransferase
MSARVQTVERSDNEFFYDLIAKFGEITGYHVLINTSFNVRGEPIVCKPEDALNCFMRTGMDHLVIGNFILDKVSQNQASMPAMQDWQSEFPLD